MAGKIFINYRRDDSISTAGRLHDRLAQTFGRKSLFIDVDHVPAGVDFVDYLHSQVAACDVFLAVIGPNWLDAKDEDGRRRLDNPDDFVAIEITAALARDIRVIPILVDGARLPKADKLPDRLKSLVRRNALEVRNTHFGRDADAVVEKVREALEGGRPVTGQWPSAAAWLLAPGHWRTVAASAIALLLVGWVGLYQIGVPVWVPWTRADQPADAATRRMAQEQRLKEEEQRQAKAQADAEAKRKAAEAEQQRLKEEEQRQVKAATDAEAKRKAAEAEQQRLAAIREEQQRQAKTADFEAKLKAAEAEQQRLKQEIERQAKAAAEAEAKRKAAEAEQQRLKEEVQRQAQAAADAEEKRKAAELEQQRLAEARPNVISPQAAIETQTRPPRLTKADITNLFKPFEMVFERVRNAYVEKPDDVKLLSSAMDAMQRALPSTQKILAAGTPPELASNATPAGSPAKVDLNALYDAALQLLNNHRSDGDDVRLVEVAIKGMLAGLDPHSYYMDAKRYSDMQAQSRGEFGGLGVELTMKDSLLKVVTPIDDTPAAKAGIMANDVITHLDDEPVQGLTLNEAIAKMRGPVNTKIKLMIMRKGQDKPVEVSIARDIIRVRSVRSRLEGDDVGIIRVTQFNAQTTDSLKKTIPDLFIQAGDKLKGFIIDLRNNPGGLLDQAISVSDAFLEKGEIVSTRGRNAEETQRFNARAGDLTKGKPIIVLINGGSASASEIVAGALQDHRRATVLGTRSFGNGSVQTIIPLGPGNGALRLTTARYFTPSGRSIQAKGISPDIEVLQNVPEEMRTGTRSEASLRGHLKAEGDEQTGSQSYIPPEPKDDKALLTALDLMRGIQKNSAYPPNPKTAVPE